MPGGGATTRDEVRRALALIRRVSRISSGLETLLRQDGAARVARTEGLDALIGPAEVPAALPGLLAHREGQGSTAQRPRPVALQVPPGGAAGRTAPVAATPRAVATSARATTAQPPAAPSRSATEAPTAAAPPAQRQAEAEMADAAAPARPPRGAKSAARKPASLREIAEMRRAQRRKLSGAAQASRERAGHAGSGDDIRNEAGASDDRQERPPAMRSDHPLAARARHGTQGAPRRMGSVAERSDAGQGPAPLPPAPPAEAVASASGVPRPACQKVRDAADEGTAPADETRAGAAGSQPPAVQPEAGRPAAAPAPAAPARGVAPAAADPAGGAAPRVADDRPARLSEAAWRNGVDAP
jgi:hypothetical protein